MSYDTWGGSWGTSWGLSWTRGAPTPPAPVPGGGGGGGTSSWEYKKQWRAFTYERSRRWQEDYSKLLQKYIDEEHAADLAKAKLRAEALRFELENRARLEKEAFDAAITETVEKAPRPVYEEPQKLARRKLALEKKRRKERRKLLSVIRRAAETLKRLKKLETDLKHISAISAFAFSFEPRIQ